MTTVSTFVMLIASFNPALTAPTAANLAVLLRGAVLAPKARTVTGCLMAAWPWVKKDWQAYGNVLRRAKINPLVLGRILFNLALRLVPAEAPICLAIDESLVRRWGPCVPAVGMHRDGVRSSHGRNIVNPGHKWVVLSILVKLSCMDHYVALPILSALYTTPRPAKRNRTQPLYRRHRTGSELALLLVRLLVRWAPQRRFIVVGDGAYATHDLANALRPGSPHPMLRRTSLVSRFYFDAALYAQPGPYSGRGRRRVKGEKLPNPKQTIQRGGAECERTTLNQWYGGQRKEVCLHSGTGLWYKSGQGPKRVRWVAVHHPDGDHRDEIFFTTDSELPPALIVEIYVRRWSLETTFQEARDLLGLETLRNWSVKAVKRSVPFLLALYSLVVVWFALHVDDPERFRVEWPWYEKRNVTFSDMLTAARMDILGEIVYERPADGAGEHLIWPLQMLSGMSPARRKKRAA